MNMSHTQIFMLFCNGENYDFLLSEDFRIRTRDPYIFVNIESLLRTKEKLHGLQA